MFLALQTQTERRGCRGSRGSPMTTYGDAVRIVRDAPDEFRPGAIASVVGMRTLTTQDAAAFGEPVGTQILTIEFGDGFVVEVPERLTQVTDDDDG